MALWPCGLVYPRLFTFDNNRPVTVRVSTYTTTHCTAHNLDLNTEELLYLMPGYKTGNTSHVPDPVSI